MDKSCHYYLASESSSSDRFCCFRAIFTSVCDIKRCIIIAPSLKDAVSLLYTELSPIWTSEYLDSHLLEFVSYNPLPF